MKIKGQQLLTVICTLFLLSNIHGEDKPYNFFYTVRRFFGPSSEKDISMMSQEEKNRELRFYVQKNAPMLPTNIVTALIKERPSIKFIPPQKYYQAIVYLITHGAYPEIQVPYEWNYAFKRSGRGLFKPIYLFIRSDNLENTRTLLEHGATLNNIIEAGWRTGPLCKKGSPLSFAKSKAMAELLIQYGTSIDFDPKDKDADFMGFDPLVKAIANPTYEVELIPFYLSHPKVDKRAFIEVALIYLADEKRSYDQGFLKATPEILDNFKRKEELLKAAEQAITRH